MHEHDDEEDAVHKEVQHVRDEVQVEDIGALAFPAALQVRIHHRQDVFDEGSSIGRAEDDVLKSKQQLHAVPAGSKSSCHSALQEQYVNNLQSHHVPKVHASFWQAVQVLKYSRPKEAYMYSD